MPDRVGHDDVYVPARHSRENGNPWMPGQAGQGESDIQPMPGAQQGNQAGAGHGNQQHGEAQAG